jgi:hypothetical protein
MKLIDFGLPMNAKKCTNDDTWAYTLKDDVDQREKIHFCDISWDLPARTADVVADCSALDEYPSDKMDALARVALHEMTHYSTVGPATFGRQIADVPNADGEPAYEPDRTHGLIHQDENPVAAEVNADSYAWMSLDAWVSRICAEDPSGNNWQTYFTKDPPDYVPEDDDDPSDGDGSTTKA